MQSVLSLRETFERYAKSKSLRTNLEVGDQGVLLGADTLVLEIEKQGKHRPSDFADLCLLALLSVANKQRIASGAVTNIRQALVYWVRGNKSLARIHLAFANLPRLESCEDAFRLFWADELIKQIIICQLDYPGDARWPYPASAPWAKGKQKP